MKRIETVQGLYSAIDDMIVELRAVDETRLAGILDHRLHRVAWTTSSELVEELNNVLASAIKTTTDPLPSSIKDQIKNILAAIENFKPNNLLGL